MGLSQAIGLVLSAIVTHSVAAGGGAALCVTPGLPPLPVIEQWTDREYVYGPDYVDEFVAQFDRDGRPMLVVQDGNLNVVALLAGADDVFFDASTNGLPAGSVLEQYVYDPYGSVRQVDGFAEHAVNRVGHQGLFFDRFDGDWENASLAPGAIGLYYNRNRFYSPPALRNVGDAENPYWRIVGLGRFISADPNETALTLVSALAMNGQSLGGPDAGRFDLGGHYTDGAHLYAYERGNPVNSTDPSGCMTLAELASVVATDLYANAYVMGSAPIGVAIAKSVVLGVVAMNAYFLATDPDYMYHLSNDVGMFAAMPGSGVLVTDMSYLLRSARKLRMLAGPSLEIGDSIAAAIARNVTFTTKRLQHMFTASGAGNHAIHFGVSGNWNKQNAERLTEAIRRHIRNSTSISGTFRGTMKGTHFYNRSTKLWAFVSDQGEFHVGWTLTTPTHNI